MPDQIRPDKDTEAYLMTQRTDPIRIDMFLDLICEWCFLSKTILDSLRDRYPLDMHYHFVEIHPDTPQGGMPMSWHAKDPARFFATIRAAGAPYGLEICDRHIFPNTHDILRVAEYANERGLAEPFIKAAWRALMTEGRNLSDHAVIEDVALRTGLTAEDVQKALHIKSYEDRLVSNASYAMQSGTGGNVPAYIIDGKYLLTGVEDDEAWSEILEKLL